MDSLKDSKELSAGLKDSLKDPLQRFQRFEGFEGLDCRLAAAGSCAPKADRNNFERR